MNSLSAIASFYKKKGFLKYKQDLVCSRWKKRERTLIAEERVLIETHGLSLALQATLGARYDDDAAFDRLAKERAASDPSMPYIDSQIVLSWKNYFEGKTEILGETVQILENNRRPGLASLLSKFEEAKLQWILPKNPRMQEGYEEHLRWEADRLKI